MNVSTMKDVTLLCLHGDKDFRLVKYALDVCQYYYKFGDVQCYTSKEAPHVEYDYPGAIVLDRAFPDVKEPMYFVTNTIIPAIKTEFVLFVQWDGFILNPKMWTDEFRNYDVIGAPWPWVKERNVGSGGFIWWSQKFMQAKVAWEKSNKPDWHKLPNEDWYLYHERREDFEQMGVKFAPEEIADQFAVECKGGGHAWRGDTFGFHDFRHIKLDTWQSPIDVPDSHRNRLWATSPGKQSDDGLGEAVKQWSGRHRLFSANTEETSQIQSSVASILRVYASDIRRLANASMAEFSAKAKRKELAALSWKRVSIVIIFQDVASIIENFLKALLGGHHVNADILVVDNGSDDKSLFETRKILSGYANINATFVRKEFPEDPQYLAESMRNVSCDVLVYVAHDDDKSANFEAFSNVFGDRGYEYVSYSSMADFVEDDSNSALQEAGACNKVILACRPGFSRRLDLLASV